MSIWEWLNKGMRWYERLGAVLVTTGLIAAPIVAAVYWLGQHRVAAWVPVAVGVPLIVAVFLALSAGANRAPAPAGRGPTQRERELERELEQATAATEKSVEAAIVDLRSVVAQSEYEKRLLTEALESVQQAIASDEGWDVDALVERGVLETSRGLLIRRPEEDVRLAVLFPSDAAPDRWTMRWAAGHRPESVQRYDHPIDDTLAGLAYRRGTDVTRGDVRADADFVPNPRETRPFVSLVAVPLRIDEQIVGTLSVVSTVENAFAETDAAFIKVLGALLNVVLAAEHDAGR